MDLAKELAALVTKNDDEKGKSHDERFHEYRLMRELKGGSGSMAVFRTTFLGKPMELSWPEGEPPALQKVLAILVAENNPSNLFKGPIQTMASPTGPGYCPGGSVCKCGQR